MTASWLPAEFRHPLIAVPWEGVLARPIRASDVDIDMIAVMGCREMLWRMYGDAWQWPPADMSREADEADLARHAEEMERHESFNYAILTSDESRLLGCIYIDPLSPTGAGAPAAEVSWWLVPDVAAERRGELDAFVPRWLGERWPFAAVETPFQELWEPARP